MIYHYAVYLDSVGGVSRYVTFAKQKMSTILKATGYRPTKKRVCLQHETVNIRGELSYLSPLGSENNSAPYFKQCFFRGGGYYPPD